MKRKSMKSLFAISMAVISVSCFAACEKHEHSYADGWYYDEQYHWKIATCGDIDIGYKSIHNMIDHRCTLCGYEDPDYQPPEDPSKEPGDTEDPPEDPSKEPGDTEEPPEDPPKEPGDTEDPPEDPPKEPGDTEEPPEDPPKEPELGTDGLTYTLSLDFDEPGYAVSADKSASGSVVIPSTYKNLPVLKIGDNAFAGSSISGITIPDSVLAIGYAAFSNCKSLTSITIPDSVTLVDTQAFEECTSLREIHLPENLEAIYYKTFYNCRALQKLTIPDKVTTIGRYVFYGCSSLTELTVGKSVKSFDLMNFVFCNSLNRVNISDLDAWCKISFGSALSNPLSAAHNLYFNDQPVKEVKFPDDLEEVSSCLFMSCYTLEKVTFSDSIKSIGFDAFDSCINLKQVDFGNCQIKTFDDQVFIKCTSLKSIVLPDSLEDMSRGTFDGCRALSKVVLGKNITKIDMYTFKDCDSLNEIYYKGSEEDWSKIWIHGLWLGEVRGEPKQMKINYDYKGE